MCYVFQCTPNAASFTKALEEACRVIKTYIPIKFMLLRIDMTSCVNMLYYRNETTVIRYPGESFKKFSTEITST